MLLLFVYVPPEHSPVYCETDNSGIEILNSYINDLLTKYPDSNLFLTGDLNSRIKDFNDFILNDEVNYVFGDDIPYPSDDFDMPRNSKDTEYNRFGLSLVELCCTYSIHVFNGQPFQDEEGNYTCTAKLITGLVSQTI